MYNLEDQFATRTIKTIEWIFFLNAIQNKFKPLKMLESKFACSDSTEYSGIYNFSPSWNNKYLSYPASAGQWPWLQLLSDKRTASEHIN